MPIFSTQSVMAKIYSLETQGLVWYVGSTARALHTRAIEHRSLKRGYGGSCISPEYEWEIKLLEACSIEERVSKEKEWIDRLTPLLNVATPGASNQSRAQYQRVWRSKHPESVKAAKRRYRANHPKFVDAETQTENIS